MPAVSTVKVAAAHAAPVYLDAQRSVDKACGLIGEAANNGARLIAFPETFIPAFPIWAAVRAPIYNHDLFRRLAANSIRVDGPEMAKIRDAARQRRSQTTSLRPKNEVEKSYSAA